MIVTVRSMPGSPGGTTLGVGLAAAWPNRDARRVLVEADSAGGRLGAELGVSVEPGLMSLAVTSRHQRLDVSDVMGVAARVGDWWLVPAPPQAEHFAAAVRGVPMVVDALTATTNGDGGGLVVVDAGRLPIESGRADVSRGVTLLVTRGDAAHLELIESRLGRLRGSTAQTAVVVVEPTAWSAAEISEFVGAEVAAVLPEVPTRRGHGLRGLRHRAWRPWWDQVSDLADRLIRLDQQQRMEVS